MYDLRFKTPSSFILAGASQCGKTSLTLNIIRHAAELFEDPRCAQNVVYFYNQWQNSYEGVKKEGIIHKWINELPTADKIEDETLSYKDRGGSIIVIDDFANQIGKDIAQVFTVLSHHMRAVIIFLTQNLFSKNPVYRDISLNATYILLFKNPRDSSQISHFARQFAPGKTNYIIDSFREATKRPYSYMLFDHHQGTPEILRVRSSCLPHELPMKIWLPKKT